MPFPSILKDKKQHKGNRGFMERQNQALLMGRKEERQSVQQVMQQVQLSPPAALSPSVSSSPAHDFSFTISLHPSGLEPMKIPDKNKRSPFAIDLSPADEIFFHGHLLPLHLLSHLPVSPRSSTNSLESFTLPIDKLFEYNNSDDDNNNTMMNDDHHESMDDKENGLGEGKVRKRRMRKSKFLSLFGLPRWRKAREDDRPEEGENAKSKFDIRQVVKRYMTLVKPFLGLIINRHRRHHHHQQQQQPYSFSGNLLTRGKKELRGRKEYSAPASMKTSRTNSGLLVTSGSVTPTKSDSTMEELQAAIQAAIAHCKNTLASEDQIKLP